MSCQRHSLCCDDMVSYYFFILMQLMRSRTSAYAFFLGFCIIFALDQFRTLQTVIHQKKKSARCVPVVAPIVEIDPGSKNPGILFLMRNITLFQMTGSAGEKRKGSLTGDLTRVHLTNLDEVMSRLPSVTKQDVITHYVRMAPQTSLSPQPSPYPSSFPQRCGG